MRRLYVKAGAEKKSMSKVDYAWHFLRTVNGQPVLRDGRPLVIGEWLKHDGPVKICDSGLHASRKAFGALSYAPGLYVTYCEIDDVVTEHEDKLVCRARKPLWGYNTESCVLSWARRVALDVAHLWNPPEVVLNFLGTGENVYAAAAYAAAAAAAADARAAAARAAAARAATYAYAARADAAAYAAYAARNAAFRAADAADAARTATYAATYAAQAAAAAQAADADAAQAADADAAAAAAARAAARAAAYAASYAAIYAATYAEEKYNGWLTQTLMDNKP